jgi:hypothetical protein
MCACVTTDTTDARLRRFGPHLGHTCRLCRLCGLCCSRCSRFGRTCRIASEEHLKAERVTSRTGSMVQHRLLILVRRTHVGPAAQQELREYLPRGGN